MICAEVQEAARSFGLTRWQLLTSVQLPCPGPASWPASIKPSQWIEQVGLAGYEAKYPDKLSDGMRQRVGLARALAMESDILLMDEAFSALDPLIRYDMQGLLLELQGTLNKTIIFITHDLDEALRIGNQIAILRDGELIQVGPPNEILEKPANDYVRRFVERHAH